MPKRVIDFDAMWGSDKLAGCAAWAQAEYAWLYGLADASGCFELTNLRVIWGRVAAIRANLTIERLEQVFAEFQEKGLLFVWEHEGKRYAHWTGSDVPGRLPPPSWRMRLERFAPPVPKQRLAEYMGRFARGRGALGGVGFRAEAPLEPFNRAEERGVEISDLRETEERAAHSQGSDYGERRMPIEDRQGDFRFEISDVKQKLGSDGRIRNSQLGSGGGHESAAAGGGEGIGDRRRDSAGAGGLKWRVEEGQAQDLGLDWNLNGKWGMGGEEKRGGADGARDSLTRANRGEEITGTRSFDANSDANSNPNSKSQLHSSSDANLQANSQANARANATSPPDAKSVPVAYSTANTYWRDKGVAVARELFVGQGPVCGPARVKPEVLERIRRREAARAGSRSG
jgi:hypothetical protein